VLTHHWQYRTGQGNAMHLAKAVKQQQQQQQRQQIAEAHVPVLLLLPLRSGGPGGVQVSVWLRLRLLLPLLPTVRADRETENKKNLRVCLAQGAATCADVTICASGIPAAYCCRCRCCC